MQKVTEEDIYEVQDKKDFGRVVVRMTAMDRWEVTKDGVIVFEGNAGKVAKYVRGNM